MTSAGLIASGIGGARRRVQRLAGFVLVLVALSWQALVAQTHHHWGPVDAPAASVATGDHGTVVRDHPASDPADNCPICQHIAHAGTLMLPEAIALRTPALPQRGAVEVAVGAAAITGHRSHAWHSRAPPPAFQA